jgi:hypothetical protein
MAVRASEVDWIARQADWLIEEPPTKSAAVHESPVGSLLLIVVHSVVRLPVASTLQSPIW